jgi:hypothetical protein
MEWYMSSRLWRMRGWRIRVWFPQGQNCSPSNPGYRANPASFPVDAGDVKYHTVIGLIYIENTTNKYRMYAITRNLYKNMTIENCTSLACFVYIGEMRFKKLYPHPSSPSNFLTNVSNIIPLCSSTNIMYIQTNTTFEHCSFIWLLITCFGCSIQTSSGRKHKYIIGKVCYRRGLFFTISLIKYINELLFPIKE